ncbi:probable G-protein coupled receptor frpr-1 [Littorina saxatilis]|uniref:G-protein coupled receptors family 1 profile domain-containing protein n=1 Tax=Littorina saxatilis TaxID=31220 RepID=A0AAN9BA82_9CAEN
MNQSFTNNYDTATVILPPLLPWNDPQNITSSNDSLVNNNTTTIPIPPPFLPWDNPDNIISRDTYVTIRYVTDVSITPLLFLICLPTNLVSALVFWRQGLKDRSNMCLFVLALVDLAYVTTLMVAALSPFIGFVDEALANRYTPYSDVYLIGVVWALKLTSGCVSVVIAVDRCLCVVFPLKIESLMSTRTMGILLGSITLVMQIFYLVHPLANDIVVVTTPGGGQVYSIVPAAFYINNKVLVDVVGIILVAFVVPIATFVVVSITTTITVVKLRLALSWRQATSSGSAASTTNATRQTSLTRMLVLLSCVYIFFAAPLVAFTLMRLALPDYSPWGRYSNFFLATHNIGTVCSEINSSVNFFVYYTRSSRFRQVLAGLYCWKRVAKSADSKTLKSETQMSTI